MQNSVKDKKKTNQFRVVFNGLLISFNYVIILNLNIVPLSCLYLSAKWDGCLTEVCKIIEKVYIFPVLDIDTLHDFVVIQCCVNVSPMFSLTTAILDLTTMILDMAFTVNPEIWCRKVFSQSVYCFQENNLHATFQHTEDLCHM